MPSPAEPDLVFLVFKLFVGCWVITALAYALNELFGDKPLLPAWPDRPTIVPWGGGSIVLVIVTWFAVSTSVAAVFYGIAPKPLDHSPGPVSELVPKIKPTSSASKDVKPIVVPPQTVDPKGKKPKLSFLDMSLLSVANAILILLVPLVLRRISGATLTEMGLTTSNFLRNVKFGTLSFFVITPLVLLVFMVAQRIWDPNSHPLEDMLREEASPGRIALAFFSAVVMAPIAEELLFRGIIQGWLRKLSFASSVPKPYREEQPSLTTTTTSEIRLFPKAPDLILSFLEAPGVRRYLPIVITSLLFAAIHASQMPAPIGIFPLSICLGLLYEKTGSLVAPIVLHAMFNGFNTTILLSSLLATH